VQNAKQTKKQKAAFIMSRLKYSF